MSQKAFQNCRTFYATFNMQNDKLQLRPYMLFISISNMLWTKGLKYEDSKFDETAMCFIKNRFASCMLHVSLTFIENNTYTDMHRRLTITHYLVMAEANLEKLYTSINLSPTA